MDLATLKPFSKKTFFLDLKNIPTRTKLAADLELLGGVSILFWSFFYACVFTIIDVCFSNISHKENLCLS